MALTEPDAVTSPESLGARVRALREAMNLSLRELAVRSGVSAPMLSQVERGETSPTLQVATRIAHGLELRLSQLLRLPPPDPGAGRRPRQGGAPPPVPRPARRPAAPHPGGRRRPGGPRRPADARARQP